MRVAVSALFAIGLLASLGVAAPPPVRTLRDLDIGVFACIPNPTHRLITSPAGLSKAFAELAPHCPVSLFEQRKAALLRGIADARLNWSEEVLVITMDWYGTGMAKPSLVFSGPANGLLTATIHWHVPPPPVTPDTASCRFAFAVRRSAVAHVKVVGQNTGIATFAVSP